MSFTASRAMRAAVMVLCLVSAIPAARASASSDASPQTASRTALSSSTTQSFWQPLQVDAAKAASPARRFELDTDAFTRTLQKRDGARIVALPLAEGGFSDFTLRDSGTLPAALAARFPELRSLRGEDVHGRRVRIDVSPSGVDAMIFADDGVQVIRPVGHGGRVHESLARKDAPAHTADRCEADDAQPSAIDKALSSLQAAAPSAAKNTAAHVHHTYHLALAATGEYTKAVCAPAAPNTSCGLAAMATTINRVNEIYENDLAVTLTLVENNDLLVFTDGATDPYSNGDTTKLLVENQNTLTDLIGNAGYDIGHVFGTGNAGRAAINVTCKTGSKARGATGRANPRGDAFDVDFVAHEIGHQFGANHTFNGNTGSCAGDNRVAGAAYEPGSGSTIMAYAGICTSQNLQANSDPYFHAHSLHELQAEIAADTCDVETPLQNDAPIVTAPAAATIPARTPFMLRAAGNDADGDAITYTWEQFDLGPVQTGANPEAGATGPLIRSYPPTPDSERSIPRLATLLGAAPAKGEVLPNGNRALHFRVTARDNHATSGRTASADATVNVVDTGAAFAILSPNGAGDTLTCGVDFNLAWNPAGTTQAPISCPAVDVLLSQDGGVNFDRVLASAIPNNGQATLHVPVPTGDTTRLQLRCSNNIFFDIGDADLHVVDAGLPTATNDVLPASLEEAPRNIPVAALLGNDGGSGTLRVAGVSNAVGGSVSLVDGVAKFVPAANVSGDAGFDYTLLDRCERGATQPVSARVRFPLTQVNDAPVLAPMHDFTIVAQKGGSGAIPGFAHVQHFGAPDEAGQQVLVYLVDIEQDDADVITEASISADGTLHAASGGGVGTAKIRVRVRDNGGTANGGQDISAERSFTITATDHANLVLAVAQDHPTVAVGDTVEYHVTLENAGQEGIGWADLQQQLPAGIEWAHWTCTASGAACPEASGSGDIDVQLPMPPHGRYTFVVSGVVAQDAAAVLKSDVAARIAHSDGTVVTEKSDTLVTQVVRTQVFSDGMED